MDLGFKLAAGQDIPTPLPQIWLTRPTASQQATADVRINTLSIRQQQLLACQIGYDLSQWDYKKIGTNNQLGRYQISTQTLEDYGLLARGSNSTYGINCVNYTQCWAPTKLSLTTVNSRNRYFYNVTSLADFLKSYQAQDHLFYQIMLDTYLDAKRTNIIVDSDTTDTIAGLIYVSLTLGTGNNVGIGTGAYAWRYAGIDRGFDGTNSFNSGRYAITVLT